MANLDPVKGCRRVPLPNSGSLNFFENTRKRECLFKKKNDWRPSKTKIIPF